MEDLKNLVWSEPLSNGEGGWLSKWHWMKHGIVSDGTARFILGCRKYEKRPSIVLIDTLKGTEQDVPSISEGYRQTLRIIQFDNVEVLPVMTPSYKDIIAIKKVHQS
jgi:hypothetical protein